MTDVATPRLNDVNLDAVGALTTAIVDDPARAATRWSASVRWLGGFRAEADVRQFTLAADEPAALGGADSAPNPVEQVLGALGSCLAIGYAANASALGITIRDLRIDLEGDLDLHTFLGLADANAGFEAIRVSVHLDTDADPEQVAALHQRVTATSPVGHTLSRPVPLTIDLA